MNQRGMMIEIYIVPAAGLVLLAMGIPALMQGRYASGLLFTAAGAGLILWVAKVLFDGWRESKEFKKTLKKDESGKPLT